MILGMKNQSAQGTGIGEVGRACEPSETKLGAYIEPRTGGEKGVGTNIKMRIPAVHGATVFKAGGAMVMTLGQRRPGAELDLKGIRHNASLLITSARQESSVEQKKLKKGTAAPNPPKGDP